LKIISLKNPLQIGLCNKATYNLKQKNVREVLGKGRNTFSRYLYDSDNTNHVTMAHADWLKLLQYIKNRNNLT
jgi:hypothetical protein